MRNRITIESFAKTGGMGVLAEILSQKNISVVAVGSMACIGGIKTTAKQLNAEASIFVKGLTAREYALGKNSIYIKELLELALQKPQTRGVIVYCSCLDVLTNFMEAEILEELNNEQNIPIDFLYRGPLVKRKTPPKITLNKIWHKWGIVPESLKEKSVIICNNLVEIDFGEAILSEPLEENILIITPGGCTSCLQSITNIEKHKLFYTRFDDVFLSSFHPKQLVDTIADYFPKDEPLLLLGTAVMKVVGISLEELCEELRLVGFSARYIATDGFKK